MMSSRHALRLYARYGLCIAFLVCGFVSAEGRIEPSDGTLMCSYHGWRLQGEGICTLVPRALNERANATACAHQ